MRYHYTPCQSGLKIVAKPHTLYLRFHFSCIWFQFLFPEPISGDREEQSVTERCAVMVFIWGVGVQILSVGQGPRITATPLQTSVQPIASNCQQTKVLLHVYPTRGNCLINLTVLKAVTGDHRDRCHSICLWFWKFSPAYFKKWFLYIFQCTNNHFSFLIFKNFSKREWCQQERGLEGLNPHFPNKKKKPNQK